MLLESVLRDPALDRGRMLVLLADDGGLERDAAAAEDGAGVDEDVEALLGDVAADGEDAEVAVARGGGRGLAQQPREVRVDPVVDEVDLRLRGDLPQMPDVRPRAGDDEAGGEQLAPQPALRVEVLGVDVARVAGEAERQAGDARRVPGDRRGAVREVRVQVADVGRVEQAVGERDRLEQLLDVDLARAREAGAAVAQRLRAGGGERAGEAERAAAGDAGRSRVRTAPGRRGASDAAAWSARRRRGGARGGPGWRRRRDGGALARAPRPA